MYLRISYTCDSASPRFPGNPENQVRKVLSIDRGDVCNAAEVFLFNHNGTHIDLPNHYHAGGRRLAEFDIADFIFERPVLVRVEIGVGEDITASMLEPFREQIEGKDLLLLRTGIGARRSHSEYTNNPYLTLDAARFLKSIHGLRAIGIDFLSVTNPEIKELGHEVHRILLGDLPDRKPVMIIEDMDLSREAVIAGFRRVFAIPLFFEEVDGMPCTVFGEYGTS